MNLNEIIKALQAASGSNAKQAILEAHKDNALLKAYLKATYDPAINYYQKKVVEPKLVGTVEFSKELIAGVVSRLDNRLYTGNQAKNWLTCESAMLNTEGQELLSLMIKGSVGAGVGDTMILNTFPGLYFIPGYMRCSLMTPKIKKHFEGLDKIIVQKKADGSFCYLRMNKGEPYDVAFTRAGSHYPQWFVERLTDGLEAGRYTISGELLVYKDDVLLDRKTGNGIYNSILKNGDEDEFKGYTFVMEAWDIIPNESFDAGCSDWKYEERLDALWTIVNDNSNIRIIESEVVDSLDKAYTTYRKYTAAGFEGAVVKDPNGGWRDHTSPYNVKLKIEFEADYEITHVTEGTGKYVGMMGAVGIKSREGKIVSDVGTGWTDEQRNEIWNGGDSYEGKILTVKANDVIDNRDSDKLSLFLPVAIEIRLDKKVADTYDEIIQQLEAAKQGK